MRISVVLASSSFLVLSAACGGSTNSDVTGDGGGGGGGGTDARVEAATEGGTTSGPPGVGANGGHVSQLLFTVIGDTRPANPDDVSGYPTAIIDKIYEDVAALQPLPLFTVSTGDYQYSSTYGGQAAAQIDLYLAARAKFSGAFFPAMGNHECTGSTDSNCGTGNKDGVTDNYTQFMTKMLGPIQKTNPYYSIEIDATDGSWTSKFVFIAANAWDSAQATWLQQTIAQKTTYTFIIRHEASSVTDVTGVTASDQIIGSNPYTLMIVGHSHTYEHPLLQEVLFGNGGAPLSGTSVDYGYGLFSQRSDGAIVVDAMDYMTNKPDPNFHFVVKPNGTITQ